MGDIAEYSNVSHEIPHYQKITHCCLVNKLMRFGVQFTDDLYPCQLLLKDASWKRISEFDPSAKFCGPNFALEFEQSKNQSPFSSKTFVEAMEKMRRFPKLIAKIFPNH